MLVSAGLPTGMEGLTYPIPFSEPAAIIRIAQHAEKLGYHSVWGNDHMTTQHYVRAEFPAPPRFWEPLMTYAFVAAATTTLRFGTGLLVLPMRRDIVVTAKQIATLDHFSGGRLEIGIGIGAYREEFEALNPGGGRRGDMVDEGLQALGLLFRDRVASFDGKYYQFRDVELAPKPLQKKLPIYVGGNNTNNIRRVVQYGADGWLPAGVPLERLRQEVQLLHELAAKAGRDPSEIAVAPQYVVHVGKTHEGALARFRQSQMNQHLTSLRKSTLKEQGALSHEDINLIGTPAEIIERALAFKAAGVTHLLGLYFAANSVQELLDQMQMFAEEVTPHIV